MTYRQSARPLRPGLRVSRHRDCPLCGGWGSYPQAIGRPGHTEGYFWTKCCGGFWPCRATDLRDVLTGWAGLVIAAVAVVWSRLAGERPERRVG